MDWIRSVSWTTWLLLGSLTVALAVVGYLTRARWRRLTPLTKCVLLSVIAHLLLIVFVSQHRWTPSVGPGRAKVRVVMTAGADDWSAEADDATATASAAPETPSQLLEPFTAASEDSEQIAPAEATAPNVDAAEPPADSSDSPPPDTRPATSLPPDSWAQEAAADSAATAAVSARSAEPAIPPDTAPLLPTETSATEASTTEAIKTAAQTELPAGETVAPVAAPSTASTPPEASTAEAAAPATPEPMAPAEFYEPPATPPLATDTPQPTEAPATPPLPSPNRLDTALPSANALSSASALPGTTTPASVAPLSATNSPESPQIAASPPTIYGGRAADERMSKLLAGGGGEDTEAAVQAALDWFAQVQESDGSWNARRHGAGTANDLQRPGAGWNADTGVTGLAVLCFLAAGETHLQGEHRLNVQRALEYLISRQSSLGSLAGDAGNSDAMYCHGMATLAVSEAYAMTRDVRLQRPLGLALAFTLNMQDPRTGGWRYTARQPGDMSQHGWQLMGLVSSKHAGFMIKDEPLAKAVRFMDGVSVGQHGGLACYYAPQFHPPSRAMTAEALFCRLMTQPPAPAAIDEAAKFILQELPGAEGRANYYYWYYATLALYQLQDQSWETWNRAMKAALLARQVTSGSHAGSWDPTDVYGAHGGRVYSTAMGTLCLEVYYRYLPLTVQVAQWNTLRR